MFLTSDGIRFSILCALFCITLRSASAADTVAQASLDLSVVEQGWGTAQRDKAVEGHPLSIGGRHFEQGLGTHSPGTFLIALMADPHGLPAGLVSTTRSASAAAPPSHQAVRDVWRRQDLGAPTGLTTLIAPHGALLLRLMPTKQATR